MRLFADPATKLDRALTGAWRAMGIAPYDEPRKLAVVRARLLKHARPVLARDGLGAVRTRFDAARRAGGPTEELWNTVLDDVLAALD